MIVKMKDETVKDEWKGCRTSQANLYIATPVTDGEVDKEWV